MAPYSSRLKILGAKIHFQTSVIWNVESKINGKGTDLWPETVKADRQQANMATDVNALTDSTKPSNRCVLWKSYLFKILRSVTVIFYTQKQRTIKIAGTVNHKKRRNENENHWQRITKAACTRIENTTLSPPTKQNGLVRLTAERYWL